MNKIMRDFIFQVYFEAGIISKNLFEYFTPPYSDIQKELMLHLDQLQYEAAKVFSNLADQDDLTHIDAEGMHMKEFEYRRMKSLRTIAMHEFKQIGQEISKTHLSYKISMSRGELIPATPKDVNAPCQNCGETHD